MPSPAAAAATGRRLAVFVGVEDDLDDSDDETVEGAFEDEDEEDEEEDEVDDKAKDRRRQKPRVASSAASTPIPNLNGVAGAGPVAVQAAAAVEDVGYATAQRKRQRTEAAGAGGSVAAAGSPEGRKPMAVLEDSRRLFQRLWTDDDEIVILQGFLDFSARRGAAAAHHHDTGPFYDQIRAHLQLDFNKSQLVEKLRRLKKKYRNVTSRMSSGKDYAFKSPHDQATFELSHKIWGNAVNSRGGGGGGDDDHVDDVDDLTPHQIGDLEVAGVVAVPEPRKPRRRGRKRSAAGVAATPAAGALVLAAEAPLEVKVSESRMPAAMAPVPDVIQETVRSCLSPMFKELLCSAVGGRASGGAGAGGLLDGLTLSLVPLGVGANRVKLQSTEAMADERWRKQQIMELEVFSKRLELVQEQIKLMLRELRSAG